ncbi:YdaU family protein [Achromobacter insolitus]|uniref:YdaU family protein n=1 Tax=Achromobacter insolitus TaxID=217204 RepID=UPI0020A54EBC|nr:YdaU family protein [Achromobacter insolitus]MCP1404597.1 uncharacterized protein YdaU (DUF1376 family) [Achromobacter insolitus]
MNYYEHHIRDYDAATAHLSWDEDMAYTRLLRWYYRKEQPIPADIKEACRQVRAATKAQRDAVATVLREFFVLQDDGWHQATCDEAIAAFQDGEPERAVKKANEENRLRKHREERSRLFKIITAAGEHAPWNIKIDDLRAMAALVSGRVSATPMNAGLPQTETLPGTHLHEHATSLETAPATPATATQAPDTRHQYLKENKAAAAEHSREGVPVDNLPPPPAAGVESTAAHFAQLLDRWERERGKAGAFHPGDPLLLAWADVGVTTAELQAAHTKAVKRRVKANDQAPVNVGLLDAILPEVRVKPGVTSAVARAETRQDPAAWALTWSGLVAQGAELGIVQQQGELDPVFKARVHTAAGLTDADRARLFADYGVRV